MALQLYVAKPHKVRAEQYLTAAPPTQGVCTCELAPAPHAHTDAGLKLLHDTDWLTYDKAGVRLTDVLTDADFTDEFGPGGAPPEATTQPA